MKIIINKSFGGFRPSDEAYEWLIKNKNWEVTSYKGDGYANSKAKLVREPKHTPEKSFYPKYYSVLGREQLRINPDLMECIEVLKEKANSKYSDLKIIEIPDDIEWEIDEYDGVESVHQKHEVWS